MSKINLILLTSLSMLRLYCDSMESDDRLACTATLQAILETLLKNIAPILPHLAEEAFSYYPLRSIFKSSSMFM